VSPTAATSLAQGETGHLRPAFLPDGRHFLYATNGGGRAVPGVAIYLSSLDSTERKLIMRADTANVVYAQGYLLFMRGSTLMAQPFDLHKLELTGEAVPVGEEIRTLLTPGFGTFSASENGLLAFQSGEAGNRSQFTWFDRSGKQLAMLGDPAAYYNVEFSPDRRQLATMIRNGRLWDIWIYAVGRSVRTRFTFGPTDHDEGIWSPDASHIAFAKYQNGRSDLYQKAVSGAGAEEALLEDDSPKIPSSWSPDGRYLLYDRFSGATGWDMFVLPLFGDRKPFAFLQTQFNEFLGRFSPDGRWVAYSSNESGRSEIYVAPFPGPGGKWQVSTGGGAFPRWRGDGSEIFYLALDNKLMAATVNGKGAGMQVGAVRPLFNSHVQAARTSTNSSYDVSADGQRFLINAVRRGQLPGPSQWFSTGLWG
jgi:hypothetical protein